MKMSLCPQRNIQIGCKDKILSFLFSFSFLFFSLSLFFFFNQSWSHVNTDLHLRILNHSLIWPLNSPRGLKFYFLSNEPFFFSPERHFRTVLERKNLVSKASYGNCSVCSPKMQSQDSVKITQLPNHFKAKWG